MSKLFFITLVYLFSSIAIAAPDCSPNLRAKGLYQCESQSHDGSENRPRKACTWKKDTKECTCCIFNNESPTAEEEPPIEQEGFDRSHFEDENSPEEYE